MSTIVGDIAVRVGADIEPLQRGMRSASQSVKGFDADTNRSAQVAKRWALGLVGATTAVVGAMAAMTKSSLDNIDATAKQARSMGVATSALQAMSMVAGEAGVSTGQLSNIMSTMQRQLIEFERGGAGAARTFQTLGLSIEQIRNLEPDKQFALIAERLNGISDPALRTATAMEVFGKAGREAINMLEGYGAKISDAEQFQRRFGVAVSETDAAAIERANDAVARLGIAFSGLGNTLAIVAAPALERFSNSVLSFAGRVADRVNPPVETFAFILDGLPSSMDAARDAEPGLSGALGAIGEVAKITSGELGFVAGWLDKIAKKAAANQALGLPVITPPSPLSGPMFSGGDGGMNELVDYLANPPPMPDGRPVVNVPGSGTVRPRSAPAMIGEPLPVPRIGGGSAVADQLAQRLDALQNGLMTENEVIDEWYNESLQTLNDALAAEKLTEEQYRSDRERLEEEHQRRLNQIRDAGNSFGLQSVLKGGAEILGAMASTNQKAAKMQAVFAAGSALMSAYQGAAKELEKGTFGFATAAAVLAKGISFASAITSLGSKAGSGGGGGAGAVSAASAAAAPAQPAQRIDINLVGDTFGRNSIEALFDQINAGLKGGRVLEGIAIR